MHRTVFFCGQLYTPAAAAWSWYSSTNYTKRRQKIASAGRNVAVHGGQPRRRSLGAFSSSSDICPIHLASPSSAAATRRSAAVVVDRAAPPECALSNVGMGANAPRPAHELFDAREGMAALYYSSLVECSVLVQALLALCRRCSAATTPCNRDRSLVLYLGISRCSCMYSSSAPTSPVLLFSFFFFATFCCVCCCLPFQEKRETFFFPPDLFANPNRFFCPKTYAI